MFEDFFNNFEFIWFTDVVMAIWGWIGVSFGWITHKIQKEKKVRKSYTKSLYPYIDEFLSGLLIAPLLVFTVPEVLNWYMTVYTDRMIAGEFDWNLGFSILLGCVSYPVLILGIELVQIFTQKIKNIVKDYLTGRQQNSHAKES